MECEFEWIGANLKPTTEKKQQQKTEEYKCYILIKLFNDN